MHNLSQYRYKICNIKKVRSCGQILAVNGNNLDGIYVTEIRFGGAAWKQQNLDHFSSFFLLSVEVFCSFREDNSTIINTHIHVYVL